MTIADLLSKLQLTSIIYNAVMSEMGKIGAIVLAGGQSSRMGSEKGLVPFCGKPMVQWVLEALHPLVSDMVIVANDPGYQMFGYRVVPDDFKEMGPVAGLCTGLRASRCEINFVLGCDMPLISSSLLQYLLDQLGDETALAAQTLSRKQPMVSIYRKAVLPEIVENITVGRLRMDSALAAAGGLYHTLPGALSDFDPDCLRNFNSPADIAEYDCSAARHR